MANRVYNIGHILILFLLKETLGITQFCQYNPNIAAVVEPCVSDTTINRQLFIPITNSIGDGCQCTVQLRSKSEIVFQSRLETTFRNEENQPSSCGFQVSTEYNGEVNTLDCNDTRTMAEILDVNDEIVYRFSGRSTDNSTSCLQIFPAGEDIPDNSGITIRCTRKTTEPVTNTMEPQTSTLTSDVSPSTTSSTTFAASATSETSATSDTSATSETSTTSQLQQSSSTSMTTPSPPTKGHSTSSPNAPVIKTSTKKPVKEIDEDQIEFIIILIGACVGGFCIIMIIIIVTCCIIYRNRRIRRRAESKQVLSDNELNGQGLEGIQFENELFIMAYDGEGEDKPNGQLGSDIPNDNSSSNMEPNENSKNHLEDTRNINPKELDDPESKDKPSLPDVIKQSPKRKVNFNIPVDVDQTLSEQTVTEFDANPTIGIGSVENMQGHIQM